MVPAMPLPPCMVALSCHGYAVALPPAPCGSMPLAAPCPPLPRAGMACPLPSMVAPAPRHSVALRPAPSCPVLPCPLPCPCQSRPGRFVDYRPGGLCPCPLLCRAVPPCPCPPAVPGACPLPPSPCPLPCHGAHHAPWLLNRPCPAPVLPALPPARSCPAPWPRNTPCHALPCHALPHAPPVNRAMRIDHGATHIVHRTKPPARPGPGRKKR